MPRPFIDKSALVSFGRPAIAVLFGAGLAQLVLAVTYFYLAARVGPEQFGYFSIWLGFAQWGAIIATLRMENGLFIEDEGAARRGCFAAVVRIIALAGAVLFGVFGLIYTFFPFILPTIPSLLWYLLVPAIVAIAFSVLLQNLAVADGKYRELNQLRVVLGFLIALCQLATVSFVERAEAMVVGFVVAQYLGVLYGCFLLRVRPSGGLQLARINAVVRRHWRLLTFALPADGLSSFTALLPVTLFGVYFGAATAGQLGLTLLVLGAPAGLIVKAVQDVFKRQAVIALKKDGNCRALYWTIFLAVAPISLLFVAFILVVAPWFFVNILGAEWQQAGEMAQILVPIFAVSFVASSLSYIVYLVEKQHYDLFWQILLFAVVISVLTGFTAPQESLFAYMIGYVMLYAIYLVMSYRLCSRPYA